MPNWYVYIVQCRDKSLYTGISTDVEARINKHNAGKGARYTRSRKPVHLVYKQKMQSESAARKREIELKCWPRSKKLQLVKEGRQTKKP